MTAVAADMLKRAEAAGRQSYADGQPAAPAADPVVRELIEGMPVGGGAAQIFRAFTRGRDAAADEAATAVLAADRPHQQETEDD